MKNSLTLVAIVAVGTGDLYVHNAVKFEGIRCDNSAPACKKAIGYEGETTNELAIFLDVESTINKCVNDSSGSCMARHDITKVLTVGGSVCATQDMYTIWSPELEGWWMSSSFKFEDFDSNGCDLVLRENYGDCENPSTVENEGYPMVYSSENRTATVTVKDGLRSKRSYSIVPLDGCKLGHPSARWNSEIRYIYEQEVEGQKLMAKQSASSSDLAEPDLEGQCALDEAAILLKVSTGADCSTALAKPSSSCYRLGMNNNKMIGLDEFAAVKDVQASCNSDFPACTTTLTGSVHYSVHEVCGEKGSAGVWMDTREFKGFALDPVLTLGIRYESQDTIKVTSGKMEGDVDFNCESSVVTTSEGGMSRPSDDGIPGHYKIYLGSIPVLDDVLIVPDITTGWRARRFAITVYRIL